MSTRTLYQFPISHCCEKARWCLDVKGLTYSTRDLIPGLHLFVTRRLTGKRTVPVLVDDGRAIGDSTEIALYLDRTYPDHPLLPKDEAQRTRALDLEDVFDTTAGVSVRLWTYGKLMTTKGQAAAALFGAYPKPIRVLGKIGASFIEKEIRRMYKVYPDRIALAEESILKAADRIEEETGKDPGRYLVGNALTIADITAASMLAPLVGPPGSPYATFAVEMPTTIQAMIEALRARPAGKWVLERYRCDRRAGRA